MQNLYSICKTRLEKTIVQDDLIECKNDYDIAAAWRKYIINEPWFTELQEMFVVFHLDTKNKIIGHHLVSIGTIDATLCHPRDVYRAAIMNNAKSIVVVHNHPSGEVEPSSADIRMSNELRKAGEIVKIDLLDSIIVSSSGISYCSLKSRGHLYGS